VTERDVTIEPEPGTVGSQVDRASEFADPEGVAEPDVIVEPEDAVDPEVVVDPEVTVEPEPAEPAEPPLPPVTSPDTTHVLASAGAVAPALLAGEVAEPDGEPAEEPAPRSKRSRRKRHRRRTRPSRTLLMAVVAIGVAALLPVLGIVAARTIADSKEGTAVIVDVPVRQLPSTPASLVVAVDDQGRPAGLTLMSVAADGQGGTVIVLPLATAAFLDGPALPVRLDEAWARGGLEGQTQGVESVLGISTAVSESLDEDGLTELFEPYAPVSLDLDLPVLDTDADGNTEELFGAGSVELSARDMARLLLARVDGESELGRLPRIEALWQAVAAKGEEAAPTTTVAGTPSTPVDVAGFLAKVTSGPAGVHLLRVEPSFDPTDPAAPELFQADVPYLRLLVASVMPGAVSPSNGNISFRIINPLGDPNLTYRAVGRLAAVQANVVLVTETDGPAPALTSMTWHSPAGEVQSGAFAPVLGSPPAVPSDERIDGIDATVVLGRDFPGFLAAEDAKVAATSTTSTTVAPTTTSRGTTTTTRRGNG
jgi:hypothetical protein